MSVSISEGGAEDSAKFCAATHAFQEPRMVRGDEFFFISPVLTLGFRTLLLCAAKIAADL
jgi:hypothetical protein